MGRMVALSAGGALLAAGAVGGAVQSAGADTLVENSAEFRFQLDFHVNDAALQKLLPGRSAAAQAGQSVGHRGRSRSIGNEFFPPTAN